MSETRASYTTLARWLSATPFQNLLDGETGWLHMQRLCRILDRSKWHLSPTEGIGLELHYGSAKKMDLSFFGSNRLLEVPGIQYPLFTKSWSSMGTDSPLQMTFNNHCVVEFDFSEYGYQLMGLFQRCSREHFNHAKLLERIQLYLDSRQDELGRPLPSELLSRSLDQVVTTCETLGAPTYVGFLDRGMMALKLVIPIDKKNITATSRFIRDYFAKSHLQCNVAIQLLVNFLERSIRNNCRPRISLDYNLEKAQFLNRLACEFTPSSTDLGREQGNELCSIVDSASDLADCLRESELVRAKLPYGQKRPSLNIASQEILLLHHAHSKLMLTESTFALKDYVMVELLECPQADTITI